MVFAIFRWFDSIKRNKKHKKFIRNISAPHCYFKNVIHKTCILIIDKNQNILAILYLKAKN